MHTTATVLRHDAREDISPGLAVDLGLQLGVAARGPQEIPIDRLVPGDVVLLSSRDLFVSQAALSGESLPVEKHARLSEAQRNLREPLELANLCFLGTNVISGSARAVVVETGDRTCLDPWPRR